MICDSVPPTYYEQLVNPYLDQYGLINQQTDSGPDGGDSSHRIGVYYLGMFLTYKDNKVIIEKIKKNFESDLNKIKIGPGKFIRNPDLSKWYSNEKNFSRDQTFSLILSLGFFDKTDEIKENFFNLLKNKGFYPNELNNWDNSEKKLPNYNDIATVSDYGNYIRSLKIYWLYPYLLISDINLFFNSIIRSFYSYYDKTDSSDDINFTMNILQSEEIMPTPLSKMAKIIYANFKSSNLPIKYSSPIQSAWDYYFRSDSGNPPLNKLYYCLIKNYFY